ncbi:hypothetical protein FH972_017206 [Carpinus fangiana]|uniref:Uncharacterized protein n=1 Tax=Carpinus fangiana TaxID=176857 RepID=A0A5N6RLK9_9ROSI|nr:hypothetical protein FH972_017206 [Carpinus fangiana]
MMEGCCLRNASQKGRGGGPWPSLRVFLFASLWVSRMFLWKEMLKLFSILCLWTTHAVADWECGFVFSDG